MTDERVKALEAVAEAARRLHPDYVTDEPFNARLRKLNEATSTLDAYTETEAKPGKAVQIAILNESDSKHACIFALCEDGRIFGKRLSRNDDEWWLEKSLPVALPVKREGG